MRFTDSNFEQMMVQRLMSRRGNPPAPKPPPACGKCGYWRGRPCVGYCIKELMEKGGKRKCSL